jgi:hypothetical protein
MPYCGSQPGLKAYMLEMVIFLKSIPESIHCRKRPVSFVLFRAKKKTGANVAG